MNNKLYIIGNGFDMWHDLPTSYKCFNCYMHRELPSEHERIGHIFNRTDANMLWSDYENMLSQLDIIGLVKNNIDTFVNCAQYNIENTFDTLYEDLRGFFHKWACNINCCSIENGKRLAIDKNANFLTFNYTNTLENLYGISSEKICYIHGDTSNNNLYMPEVGHGDSFVEDKVHSMKDEIFRLVVEYGKLHTLKKDPDYITDEIMSHILTFLKDLRKNTDSILENNINWFNNLRNIDEIYVLGHSLAKVDAPYFSKIHSMLPNAIWRVSYFGANEKCNRKQKLCELLEVSPENINVELFTLDELAMPSK